MYIFLQPFIIVNLVMLLSVFPPNVKADSSHVENQVFKILPQPKEIRLGAGSFTIDSTTQIVIGKGGTNQDEFTSELLNETIQGYIGSQLTTLKETSKAISNGIWLGNISASPYIKRYCETKGLIFTSEMNDEGYILDISQEEIIIAARTSSGLYYGYLTLAQLLQPGNGKLTCPCVTIRDWPSLKIRGISDDISRGQVSTIENFKKIIRFLSEFKMNTYMLYLEDMFVFKKHPVIGLGRGALIKEEVTILQDYAERFHVEIIPIFQTLGHYENILIKPEYWHLAEYPGAASLNVTSKETIKFLEDLFSEIAPAFRSKYFHIGADESWDVGRGESFAKGQQIGFGNLHAEHYNRVYKIAKKYHKTVMMYGDIILKFPSILTRIPPDIIIVDWHYHPVESYPSINKFKEAGRQFIVSPGLLNWCRIFPNYMNSLINIESFIRKGHHAGALGAITSSWGDHGSENFRELNYYGYAYAAECTWAPEQANISDFNDKFFLRYFGPGVPEMAAIYALLLEVGKTPNLPEFWRHPFGSTIVSQTQLLLRIHNLKTRLRATIELIEQVAHKKMKHKEHLDYLAYAARRGLLLARKLQYADEIKRMTRIDPSDTEREEVKRNVIAMCQVVIRELQALKDEYEQLWLKTNKSNNLQLILELFDRQIYYWQEKVEQVNDNLFWVNPGIQSRWIYHPVSDSENAGYPQAYFRKSFRISKPIQQVQLQAIGDMHLTIYINGEYLDEVRATRSPSLLVEMQRVRVWELTERMKIGKNTIAVKAEKFNKNRSPGLNIYCKITYEDGSIERVLSDGQWRVSATEYLDWQNPTFYDAGWRHASEVPSKWYVTNPNFVKGFPSWIEF